MTTSLLALGLPRSSMLKRLFELWSTKRKVARQLRHLDELPPYLLRDIGLDHLSSDERRRLGQHRIL